MDVRHLVEEAEHDDVRRSADRCQNTADRAGIRGHEHQPGRVLVVVQVDLLAVRSHHFLDGGKQAEGDREHHRGGRRIAHPAGAERRSKTNREEDAAWIRADPRAREQPVGKSLVEPVIHHRLCEDKSTHEEEDHRIGECRIGILCRNHACHDSERRPDERRDGDGHGFRDPPECHQNHDGEQLVGCERESLDRRQKHQNREDWRTDQTDETTRAIKFLLSLMYLLGFFALISTHFFSLLTGSNDNSFVYFIIRNFEVFLQHFSSHQYDFFLIVLL